MTQKHHEQHGTFHVTTVAEGRMPWCTYPDIPEMIINNLFMTRSLQNAEVFAFCILPEHVHILLRPGLRGLSDFLQSFKRNSSKDANYMLNRSDILDRRGIRTPATDNIQYRSSGSDTRAIENDDVRIGFNGWQNGFHDERIRDADQRTKALHYILHNAVHHGLVKDPHDWPWTSLHCADRTDPLDIWLY